MLVPHHIEITRQAIGADVSPRALEVILRANLRQDGLRYQLGHDHFHFDNNQFEKSYAYIEEQRALVRASLERGDAQSAWQAFGRMIHTVQDFYAHSDYIPRWLSRFDGRRLPRPRKLILFPRTFSNIPTCAPANCIILLKSSPSFLPCGNLSCHTCPQTRTRT